MIDSFYDIQYLKTVAKDLRKLAQPDLKKVVEKIQGLKTNPFPEGSVKLHSSSNIYRIRQGDYRIIYQVEKNKLIILIIKVGHRKKIYRDL